jgi:hypothetical protein
LKLDADRLSLAGKEVMHELVCPDGGASNEEAVSGVQDAEFGCCGRCHICIRAVRGALTGYEREADETHFRCQGFESWCCSCGGADNIDVVKICNNLCFGMHCGCALKWTLEREGEEKGSDGVPLFHTARREDRPTVQAPSEENP